MSQLKTEVANSENDIFDIQNKLEKLGKATDEEGTENLKAIAIREVNDKMEAIQTDKGRYAEEIA